MLQPSAGQQYRTLPSARFITLGSGAVYITLQVEENFGDLVGEATKSSALLLPLLLCTGVRGHKGNAAEEAGLDDAVAVAVRFKEDTRPCGETKKAGEWILFI